jgi:hypothetical protein
MAERPGDWLTHLETEFKIDAVRDGDRVSLKYNMIESPMAEPIVQQCRGMVVDTARRAVLAWPYDKFWNHGEGSAARIDWSTARVQEKLDGSLMILYWDAGAWWVASSGHPTAGGGFAGARTFRDAFWQTARDLEVDLAFAEPGIVYMLELCDAPNRVVVRHERPRLVLHGARAMASGVELARAQLEAEAARLRVELVREWPIRSIEECLTAADALNPLEQEGFVVVDAAFHRVKIKSPRYVILHHMKGDATPRRAIELWQTGETSELLAHFPELATTIEPVHADLDRLADQALADFHANRHQPSRKDFALAIKDRPYSAVLFKLLGHASPGLEDIKAIMRKLSTSALERMLGLTTTPT